MRLRNVLVWRNVRLHSLKREKKRSRFKNSHDTEPDRTGDKIDIISWCTYGKAGSSLRFHDCRPGARGDLRARGIDQLRSIKKTVTEFVNLA